jgi:dehydrogenase/reductase SDR family protein 1
MEQRGEWKDASGGLDLNLGETPQFTGRAVATLLSRPEVTKARSGKVIVVAELAKEIGFTDVDGTVPASIRNLQFILPGIVFPQMEKKNGRRSIPGWIKNNVPDVLLPWFIFSGGPPPAAE